MGNGQASIVDVPHINDIKCSATSYLLMRDFAHHRYIVPLWVTFVKQSILSRNRGELRWAVSRLGSLLDVLKKRNRGPGVVTIYDLSM
jgi:hypothetical protein